MEEEKHKPESPEKKSEAKKENEDERTGVQQLKREEFDPKSVIRERRHSMSQKDSQGDKNLRHGSKTKDTTCFGNLFGCFGKQKNII